MYLFIGSINVPLIGLMLRIEQETADQRRFSRHDVSLRERLQSITPAVGDIEELSHLKKCVT